MKAYKAFTLVMVICSCILLSGCWDSIEINKRAFVLGMGMDKAEENNKYITYEIAIPTQISKGAQEESNKIGGSSTRDFTKKGSNIVEADVAISESIDKTVDLQHMQLFVIGKSVAQEGITNNIDFLFRSPQVRRRAKVVYYAGNLADFFKVEPKTTKSPSVFVSGILDNNGRFIHSIPVSTEISKLSEYIRENYDFILPKVNKVDDELNVSGAGAFRDGKLVCDVEKEEIKEIEWVQGKVNIGNIEVSEPQNPEKKVVYGISEGKSSLKPEFSGDKLTFNFKMTLEGDIDEEEDTNYLGVLKPEYSDSIEKLTEEKVRADIMEVFNKYEKEKKVDVFMLKRKIKSYNIKYYEKNKNILNDIITESDFNIDVVVKVRRVGLTR